MLVEAVNSRINALDNKYVTQDHKNSKIITKIQQMKEEVEQAILVNNERQRIDLKQQIESCK